MLGLAAILVTSSLRVRWIDPVASSELGISVGLSLLFYAIWYAVLGVVSYFSLELLLRRRSLLIGAGVIVAFVVVLLVAGRTGWAPVLVCGIALESLAYVWLTFLFVCRLVYLPSVTAAAIAIVGGIVLRQLALPLYTLPMGYDVAVVVSGVLLCVAGALLTILEPGVFTLDRSGEALVELETTNPMSRLWPPARVMVCAFLISFAYNYVSPLGVPGLSARRMIVVVVLLVLLYLLLIQNDGQEDKLFSLIVLFIMAGLLITPITLGYDNFWAHTFIFLGSTCFSTLLWLLVFGMGKRNFAATIPAFGTMMCLESLGRFAGGSAGDAAIAAFSNDPVHLQAVTLLMALIFFAFVWLAFRRFSFTEAIRGIEDIAALPETNATRADEPQTEDKGGRCRELVREASLTPREAEIFQLLAAGRNAQYIMDTLHVTRNTAKAHIKHIYTKLGVHSHQELLTLIESGG